MNIKIIFVFAKDVGYSGPGKPDHVDNVGVNVLGNYTFLRKIKDVAGVCVNATH